MQGLTEHEEVDYWRKRCEQAERDLAQQSAGRGRVTAAIVEATRKAEELERQCLSAHDEAVRRILATRRLCHAIDRWHRYGTHEAERDVFALRNELSEGGYAERELAKYEAVVQAAREWRKCFDDDGEIVNRPRLGDVEVALTDAIDALDSKEQSP